MKRLTFEGNFCDIDEAEKALEMKLAEIKNG